MNPSDPPSIIVLPERLDGAAAEAIYNELCAMSGAPVKIDASEVSIVGAHGAQLLLAAKKYWAEEGFEFSIEAGSAHFVEGLSNCGLESLIVDGGDTECP